MNRYMLYNSGDIEKLKRELSIYKHVLDTIKLGDIVENYMKTKSEFYELKFNFLKLEGEMKAMEENFQETETKYKVEEQNLLAQINAVDESLTQLKKDVNKMMDKVEQINYTELIEKINHVINKQDEHLNNEKNEIDKLKEEILQLKEQIKTNNSNHVTKKQQASPRQSEYRRLQSMVQSSKVLEQPRNQKKNSMTPTQNFGKPIHGSQSSYLTDTSRYVTNTNQRSLEKRIPHYELNKNTFIRSSSEKNTQKKMETETNSRGSSSLDSPDNISNEEFSSQNNMKDIQENNIGPKENPKLETKNADQQDQVPDTPKSPQTESPTNEVPASNIQNDVMMRNDDQQNQSDKKADRTSLFSIFRKS